MRTRTNAEGIAHRLRSLADDEFEPGDVRADWLRDAADLAEENARLREELRKAWLPRTAK